MKKKDKAIVVAVALFMAAIPFPYVLLIAGLQQQVAETAVKAGTGPMTYYGLAWLAAYVTAWVGGAILGCVWIFRRSVVPAEHELKQVQPSSEI